MSALADLAALGEPVKPVLDAGIFVEPKDRAPDSEDDRQAVLVAALKRLPGIKVVAVPNGGKRTRWAAAKAKREGMHKGWPDLGIIWAYGCAWIEMKAGRTSPDYDQIETLNWLHGRGHLVAVCRTKAGALAVLEAWGAPV